MLYGAQLNKTGNSFTLLLLRVFAGILILLHGWGKLSNFGSLYQVFPDPIGLGSRISLILAIGAEFFASIFLIFGLLTRLALIPLAFTMVIAFFVIHSSDPLQVKELALLFLGLFIYLFLTGPGDYSLDRLLFKKFRK